MGQRCLQVEGQMLVRFILIAYKGIGLIHHVRDFLRLKGREEIILVAPMLPHHVGRAENILLELHSNTIARKFVGRQLFLEERVFELSHSVPVVTARTEGNISFGEELRMQLGGCLEAET